MEQKKQKYEQPLNDKAFMGGMNFEVLRLKYAKEPNFNCEFCGIDTRIPSFYFVSSYQKVLSLENKLIREQYFHSECKINHQKKSVKKSTKQSFTSELNRTIKRIEQLKKINKK